MNHYRAMLCAVSAGVFKIEPFRQLHVELYRSALPGSAKAVRNMEVKLGTIESAIAFVNHKVLAKLGNSFL